VAEDVRQRPSRTRNRKVHARSSTPTRSPTAMSGRPVNGDRPFVGRAIELTAIAEACAEAREGRGRLLVVRGPAGIGKTALCARAAHVAAESGFTIGWGRAWAEGGAPPLWPWPDVLVELGGDEAAGLLTGDVSRGTLDPDRFVRFSAVAERFARLADDEPVMIVIDDAQASHTASLLLVRFLASSIDRARVVLVLVRRTDRTDERDDIERLLDGLEREATVVALTAFDDCETSQLLAAGGIAVEDDGLVPALNRLTDGNPLLISGAVMHGVSPDRIDGVERIIGDALDALPPAHRWILGVAAVVGMEFDVAAVASLADRGTADVHDALSTATSEGLVDANPSGWAFTHDLVRRAALDGLTPAETLDTHARAAALVPSDDRPAAVARRAHHALAAASRGDADADIAVACCRHAARILSDGFDYEAAALLLDSAVELVERSDRLPDRVDVLLEWADALQVCGRLTDAREAYERCATAAASAGEPQALARAALGLGGVWVNEHRGEVEWRRVLQLQEAALAGLPADDHGLRARLAGRLAAEAVYDGEDVAPVLAAVEAARRLGDEHVLAEVLSLSQHALLAPEHLDHRLPLADELIAVASAAGDSLRVLFGLMWKAVALVHGGDIRAERTLAHVRQRADAVGCRSILFAVAAIDVMRQIRAGRLDAAESAAEACLQLGLEVGDADATGYYGAHLLTIRWLQDRDTELLDVARDIATSATLVAPEFAFRAAAATIAARAGDHDEANAILRQLRVDGLPALPRSSTWLMGMVIIVEAARETGDGDLAREVYGLLSPFADRPAMPSLGVTCFGTVERALGVAAMTWGDHDLAVEHLDRAVDANIVLGNRPFTAVARGDLAQALRRRDGPGDRSRAGDALRRAIDAASEMGMARRAERWRGAVDELCDDEPTTAVLRREGGRWIVASGQHHVVAPDLVGFTYLGSLLARPGDEIAASELCGGAVVEGTGHDLVDRETLDSYRRRVAEIDRLLQRAREAGRVARVRELEGEREALRAELSAVLSKSGRSRRFVDQGERARTAVCKAIKRAIDAIAATDDDLAAELRATIVTGRRCSYTPDPASQRQWSVVVDQ